MGVSMGTLLISERSCCRRAQGREAQVDFLKGVAFLFLVFTLAVYFVDGGIDSANLRLVCAPLSTHPHTVQCCSAVVQTDAKTNCGTCHTAWKITFHPEKHSPEFVHIVKTCTVDIFCLSDVMITSGTLL